MSLIGTLLGYALTAFLLLLVVRVVLDWLAVLPDSSVRGGKARALTHAWTEPVIAPVRRVLRPVRAGGLSIDLAFTAVFLLALVLRGIAFSL
ncbi:YggT family protein [Kutzneria viridogrisea]|uniref:YggT family protein n=2 Tax=Kutzneria TaxID=43356 RepID=A0ABR6BME4_9PSEU|nr:YggT family protein [Kutzneria albida]AHH96704.1 putative membrane protein [Kutzneria albida DSM 43870]MBA8928076.1 YggT family protein [Kutzneria viridogrisea]